MFRFTRSLLYRAKEYNYIQNIYRSVTSKQNVDESMDAKTQEDVDDIKEKTDEIIVLNEVEKFANDSEKPVFKSDKNDKHQKHYNKIITPIDLSKIMSEDEVRSWSKSLTPSKIIEIMKFLSAAKNRPVKLLKVLSEKITTHSNALSLKECADLMYCLGIFSFKDEILLDKLAENIILNKQNFKTGVLPISILQSCGILKYRNCDLLDILLQQILIPNAQKSNKSQLKALLTLSAVNYFPPYGKVILNELLECSVKDFSQTKFFLDFVWACVILNHYPEEQISYVLSENFINQLEVAEGYFGPSEPINLKLLNIDAAATYLMPSYKGPKIKKNTYINLISKKKTLFLESVIDGLSHVFPKNGYLQYNVSTKAGFVLDIECFMDSNGNPVSLKKKKDYQKMGIMLLDFNDFCLGKDNVECGLVAFKERILKAMGYKIVKISYLEYNTYTKLYEKVHYLQKKLEEANQKR